MIVAFLDHTQVFFLAQIKLFHRELYDVLPYCLYMIKSNLFMRKTHAYLFFLFSYATISMQFLCNAIHIQVYTYSLDECQALSL